VRQGDGPRHSFQFANNSARLLLHAYPLLSGPITFACSAAISQPWQHCYVMQVLVLPSRKPEPSKRCEITCLHMHMQKRIGVMQYDTYRGVA
jgi:hypothetical protein